MLTYITEKIMKKGLALLVGVLFVMVAVFASCGQAAATAKYTRWDEKGETHTFKISLADFANDNNTLFKNYTKKITQKNSDNTSNETMITCYRDDVVSASELTLMQGYLEARPVDAYGEFTMTISYDTPTTRKLVTTETIYSQYKTKTLEELECLNTFKGSKIDVTNSDENPFENNENRITLRSQTTATVIFANDENQLPVSSVKENKGFYIGAINAESVNKVNPCGLSSYKYETTYDFTNRKVTVKKDGGEAEERQLNIAKNGGCIDASQMLLYIRSLDKSSEGFGSTPTVSVYDVTTNNVSSATFALNRDFYLILDNAGSEVVAKVNAVTVAVGGTPFLAQYNLPDLTSAGYDSVFLGGQQRCKNTTVKFRKGWYSYELKSHDKEALNVVSVESAS